MIYSVINLIPMFFLKQKQQILLYLMKTVDSFHRKLDVSFSINMADQFQSARKLD